MNTAVDIFEELASREEASAVRSENFIPIEIDTNTLREVMRYDHESFIRFMLADDIPGHAEIPLYVLAGFRLMISDHPDDTKLALAWPRGHMKTTLAKLAATYRLLYGLSEFLLYVSNTSRLAANAVRDIADFLTKDRVEAVYGRIEFSLQSAAKGQYSGTHYSANGTVRLKFYMLALGAMQQVRGTNQGNKRPDLMVVDDLDSAEEGEENKLGYKGLITWFYGTLRKALKNRQSKIIQIGNYVVAKSVLGDHINSLRWKSVKLSAFNQDGQPLWPGMWSLKALIEDFLEYLEARQGNVWIAEMLNIPFGDTSAGIKPDNVKLERPISPGDPRILLRCITVDPAISSNMKLADASVAAVHVLVDPGDGQMPFWQLADMSSEKGRGPYKLYSDIVALALKWRVRAVGIESDAFQEALIHIAETESARSGYHFFEWIKLTSMKRSKASRIIAWSEMLNRGDYRLSQKYIAVLVQLFNYDIHRASNVDNEIDCCAYLLHMVKSHLAKMTSVIAGPKEQVAPIIGESFIR